MPTKATLAPLLPAENHLSKRTQNRMKAIPRIFLLFLSFSLLLGFTACGDDTADDTAATTNTCVIYSAVMGGLQCQIHTTTADGRDSTYEVTLTGSNYPLSIDQVNNRIYLHDSLPAGTDISRVTFTTFTYGGTNVVIRSLHEAGDTIFNTADSTDCRLPRLFTVYGSDGSQRQYTLELKVHQQTGEEMNWTQTATSPDIAALQQQRLIATDEMLYLFGRRDEQTLLLTSADGGSTWQTTELPTDLNPRSVNRFGNAFVALTSAGQVVASTDGQTWTQQGEHSFSALIVSSQKCFGIADQSIYSSTDLTTWQQDLLAANQEMPASQWSAVALPSRTNTTYEDLLLTGLAADGTPVLWSRTLAADDSYTFPWNPIHTSATNAYPALQQTSLILYDDSPLLAGIDSESNLPQLYVSKDRGRTWLVADYALPDISAVSSLSAATRSDNYLWLTCGGTGQVWRGRLARLAWKEIPHDYYRTPRR